MDIQQLNRKIQDDQVRADNLRKQAQTLRDNASKMYDGENDARRRWLEDEAMKQEQQAAEIDKEIVATQQTVQENEQKLHDLEQQRASKIAQHEQEIQALDAQINDLRGPTILF
jgi:chromosome segregation ATPase